MSTPAIVDTHRAGTVLVITLQREAKRNAVNREMADALDRALNLLDDEPDLQVGVLSGGPRYFCAGSDLSAVGDYVCRRRSNIDPPCRSNTDPGMDAGRVTANCG